VDRVFLFDWGNTLMVDDPAMSGKMKDWPQVSAIPGAKQVLKALAETNRIYVASGARDSDERDIEAALERVGLSAYISGYFCPANLGQEKGSAAFLEAVLLRLSVLAQETVVVGDSYEKDIRPSLAVGVQPVWLCQDPTFEPDPSVRVISELMELLFAAEQSNKKGGA